MAFTMVKAEWFEIPSGTSENLNTIEFIGDIGFVGGANGELLKSVNGGETWTPITSGTSSSITAIHFVSSGLGFFTSADGKIFKSTNGGTSWTGTQLQTVGALNGVDFLNSTIGLTVGDNGSIYRTANGGTSWDNLGNVSVFVVNDVAFINDTLAVAIGAQGSILSSSDAGITWDWKGNSSTNTYSAIEKKNSTTASIVGTGGAYLEFSAVTMLPGSESIIDSENDWLKDIHLASSEKMYIAGNSQTIMVTNPGWKTWDLDSVNNLSSIHFYNDTIGYACGLNGKLYKTITAGFPVSSNKVEMLNAKVFPNPATSHIQIDLPNLATPLKLSIYSINGTLVLTKTISSSERIDISSLKYGLYTCLVRSERSVFRSRFMKCE